MPTIQPETDQMVLGRQQITKSAAWRLVEVIGAEMFAFGAFIISARLLLPNEVGTVAQATLFILTAQMLLHQGLGEALIQSDDVDSQHFSSAFWANLALGATASVLLIVTAGPIAALLDEPLLGPVLRALAPVLLLFAASGIYQAKLRRALQLRGFALASVTASMAGGAMAITLASLGFGVWSLVAQQWVYACVSLAVFACSSGWLPGFVMSKDHIRKLGAFGGLTTISALLQFAMRRLDLLILSYFLPTLQVGFFSVANRLMMSVGMLTYFSIQQIGLPVLSRLAHNPRAHRLAIYRTLRLVSLICLPTLCGLALIADLIIPLALGDKWLGSVAPFQVLCVFGVFYAMTHIVGQVLLSAGHAIVFVKLSALNVFLFLAAVTIAAPIGMVEAAFAGGVANLIVLPLYFLVLKRKLGFSIQHFLLDQWPIWIAAGTMISAVSSWSYLAEGSASVEWLLAGSIMTGGLSFLAVMALLSYDDVKEICVSFAQVVNPRASNP